MAGIIEKISKMWNPPEDEYEEYYDDEEIYEEEAPVQTQEEPVQPAPSVFRRNTNKVVNINRAQLQVVVFKPMSYSSDTRDIADALMQKCAVVLNLERTPDQDSKRILDFLSGVAYANNGKIKRVATGTYMITPHNVDLSGEELFDEFENSGVYF